MAPKLQDCFVLSIPTPIHSAVNKFAIFCSHQAWTDLVQLQIQANCTELGQSEPLMEQHDLYQVRRSSLEDPPAQCGRSWTAPDPVRVLWLH